MIRGGPIARSLSMALFALALAGERAHGERVVTGCPGDLPVAPVFGQVARVLDCDAFVLTSDGAPGAISRGRASWRQTPRRPYRLSMTLQRLDGDARHSVAIGFMGGWLLLRRGAWGYYEGESAFARDGWRPAPFLDPGRPTQVVVEDRATDVRVTVDGHAFPGRRPQRNEVSINIELKAAAGERARMLVQRFRVEPLPDPRR